MRTWQRATTLQACGSCTNLTPKGVVFMVIHRESWKLARCAACAKRMFGEDAPTELPDETLPVPQPSLPLPIERRPDFVTPKVLARAVRGDYKRRQSGENE